MKVEGEIPFAFTSAYNRLVKLRALQKVLKEHGINCPDNSVDWIPMN